MQSEVAMPRLRTPEASEVILIDPHPASGEKPLENTAEQSQAKTTTIYDISERCYDIFETLVLHFDVMNQSKQDLTPDRSVSETLIFSVPESAYAKSRSLASHLARDPELSAHESWITKKEGLKATSTSEADPILDIKCVRNSFVFWVEYIGAMANIDVSLDTRLAGEDDVKEMIVELLLMLERNLHKLQTDRVETANPGTTLREQRWLSALDQALDRLHFLARAIRQGSIRKYEHDSLHQIDEENTTFQANILLYLKQKHPNATPSLRSLLGDIISGRRRILLLKQQHTNKLRRKRQIDPPTSTEVNQPTRTAVEVIATRSAKRINSPNNLPRAVETTSGVTQASTFNRTAVLKLIHQPVLSARTIGSLHAGISSSAEYPEPPSIEEGGKYVQCPYCFQPLEVPSIEVRKATNDGYWRHHVNQDLQPYVCLFPRCQKSSFGNRADWKSHMYKAHSASWPSEVHSTVWYCDLGHLTPIEFAEESEWRSHMQTLALHPGWSQIPSDAQLETLLSRKQKNQPRDLHVCLFCENKPDSIAKLKDQGKSVDMSNLLIDHIAEHSRSLLLLALPGTHNEATGADTLSNIIENSSCKHELGPMSEASIPSGAGYLDHISLEFDDYSRELQHMPYFSQLTSRSSAIEPIYPEHVSQDSADQLRNSSDWEANDWFSGSNSGQCNDHLTWAFLPHKEVPLSAIDTAFRQWHNYDIKSKKFGTLPFRRDFDFVNRGSILEAIHHSCAILKTWTVLVGMGGTGKSQIAIEYAYRLSDLSPKTCIFWIHASSAARFEQGFRDIARDVGIGGLQDPGVNVFQLVYDWLCQPDRHWLLILDNLDDGSFLFEPSEARGNGGSLPPLASFLPRPPTGAVLITTRSAGAVQWLIGRSEFINIGEMSPEEATRFMNKKLSGSGVELLDDDYEAMKAIVEELGCLPLALVQAAAHIVRRAPRYSARQYLNDFQRSRGQLTHFLQTGVYGQETRRDWEAPSSLQLTMNVSFERIYQLRLSAANLLSLMSFFEGSAIQYTLIRRGKSSHNYSKDVKCTDLIDHAEHKKHEGQSDDIENLEEDIRILKDFSLITVKTDGVIFEIHRLVQLAVQNWLSARDLHDMWRHESMKCLDLALPTADYENWETWRSLLPHAQLAAMNQPKDANSMGHWASILYKTACYASAMGKWSEVEGLALQTIEVRKRILGQYARGTLSAMTLLGLAYEHQSKWSEAESLQLHIIETTKGNLNAHNPATLNSMDNLGSIYLSQGRWEEAETLFEFVVRANRTVLGERHPSTLHSMTNLASTYRQQGRWKEAEALERLLVHARRQVLEEEHPNMLRSKANLASTLWNQGRWDDAEKLQVEVLQLSKKILGEEHPSTLSDMANLALTYRSQGRWDEAEKLQGEVLQLGERVLGEEHPNMLRSMANLASTLWSQGRWDEAEKLQVKVLELSRKMLGEDHPSTLSDMANLASTYRAKGQWDEAEKLQVKVLELSRKMLGEKHPSTLSDMANLASTYKAKGQRDEAEKLQVVVLQLRKRMLGEEHPDTLASMANLASTWKEMGRLAEGIKLMEECIQAEERVLGPDHPHTTSIVNSLRSWRAEQKLNVLSL